MGRKFFKNLKTRYRVSESNASDSSAVKTGKNPIIDVAETPLTPQILVISLIANMLGLAMPLTIFQVYDRILPNQAGTTLFWLISGLLAAVIIDSILRSLRSYILGWAALKNGHQAQQLAMAQMLKGAFIGDDHISRAKWLDGLDAIGEFSSFQGSQNRTILIDIPMALIFLGVVAMVGGMLVIVPIILILAFGLFSYLQGQEIQTFLDKRSQQDNRQNDFLFESLSNIQTVKNLAVESQLLRRFELLQKTSTHSSYNAIISTNKLQAQGIIFSNMMMVSVVSIGAIFVIGGDMSLAALACCSLLTGRMVQPFARALTLFHELQNVSLAQKRCGVFDGLSDEVVDFSDEALDGEEKLKSGSLSVRNILLPSSGEDHSDERFSFSAKPGEFIGIHCQENVERTELVRLLYGEKIPEKGSVFADGFSSKQWRELGIHKEISIVTAKSEIFEGTIIDNITMFGTSHMVESAREAARLIGLEQDIFKLPEGYDTILNVGSTSVLSPGFLQRIKIARALRSKPKLLIFDGANSNMDMRSDKLLTEGLVKLKGQMTAVYFSSRPSFLKISDQRFKLDEGQLLVDTFVPGQTNAIPAKSAVGSKGQIND